MERNHMIIIEASKKNAPLYILFFFTKEYIVIEIIMIIYISIVKNIINFMYGINGCLKYKILFAKNSTKHSMA